MAANIIDLDEQRELRQIIRDWSPEARAAALAYAARSGLSVDPQTLIPKD